MSEKTIVSINPQTGAITLEGSEAFVKEQLEKLEDLLRVVSKANAGAPSQPQGNKVTPASDQSEETDLDNEQGNKELFVPDVFGEWLHSFKDGINDQEKSLVTAYFVQSKSEANEFKTSEVTKFLTDHGIKLSNASATLKQIEKKKLIFQTRKPSKISYKRVSADGVNHLKSLLR